MGKQWAASSSITGEPKPVWLTDAEKDLVYASNAGWVMKHPDGTEELLVAIAGLKTRLGAASIVSVKFATGTYTAGGTKSVRVQFNEKIAFTGSPTITVLTDVEVGDVTATLASIASDGYTAVFNFTVPPADDTLSLGAQTIALAGGTITEAGVTPTVNAELVISAGMATAAGTKVTV